MTEPTHFRSSRMKTNPSIYHVEVTAGELTRIYEIEARSYVDAELKAWAFWRQDEARAREIEEKAE